ASKLNYAINDMTTTVEGDWDSIMKLMKQCCQKVLETADRVALTITIDDRKDKVVHLGDKVKAVEQAIGKTLKK
ncbi:MAG TPA: thiamine-binding protein, partial [Candidatus Hypogeohydataceae bacterium YC40]